MKNESVKYLFILLILVNLAGCCSYSFTGASVPEHLKTIAIPIADDRSGSAEPMNQLLTNKLIKKFTDDNTLRITDKSSANSVLECTIISYNDAPSVVTGGENVTKRKISITVRVVYRDLVKRKTIFEKNFSDSGDYATSGDTKATGIGTALDNISENILLDTVSGW